MVKIHLVAYSVKIQGDAYMLKIHIVAYHWVAYLFKIHVIAYLDKTLFVAYLVTHFVAFVKCKMIHKFNANLVEIHVSCIFGQDVFVPIF